jgi:hypothetical protein
MRSLLVAVACLLVRVSAGAEGIFCRASGGAVATEPRQPSFPSFPSSPSSPSSPSRQQATQCGSSVPGATIAVHHQGEFNAIQTILTLLAIQAVTAAPVEQTTSPRLGLVFLRKHADPSWSFTVTYSVGFCDGDADATADPTTIRARLQGRLERATPDALNAYMHLNVYTRVLSTDVTMLM